MKATNPNDQVFINCPFDKRYLILFRAALFTVLDAGFLPRCSLELDDGTEFRLGAILTLIRECKYGVHDLSRIEIDAKSKLPRFNMPFELGLFHSAKHFGETNQRQKQCLILEKEKYRYQIFISDIAGIDVAPHENSPDKLIFVLRNWLRTASKRTTIPPGAKIKARFYAFEQQIKKACKKQSINYDEMPFIEIIHNMTEWLKINQQAHKPLIV